MVPLVDIPGQRCRFRRASPPRRWRAVTLGRTSLPAPEVTPPNAATIGLSESACYREPEPCACTSAVREPRWKGSKISSASPSARFPGRGRYRIHQQFGACLQSPARVHAATHPIIAKRSRGTVANTRSTWWSGTPTFRRFVLWENDFNPGFGRLEGVKGVQEQILDRPQRSVWLGSAGLADARHQAGCSPAGRAVAPRRGSSPSTRGGRRIRVRARREPASGRDYDRSERRAEVVADRP